MRHFFYCLQRLKLSDKVIICITLFHYGHVCYHGNIRILWKYPRSVVIICISRQYQCSVDNIHRTWIYPRNADSIHITLIFPQNADNIHGTWIFSRNADISTIISMTRMNNRNLTHKFITYI